MLLLWVAWSLRLHQLGQESFWIDEIFTWRYSSPTLLEMPRALYRQAQPLLAMLPFHLALRLGEGEFLLRFPAACFGLLVVPAACVLVQRVWGRVEGWLAAGMVAVSPFLVQHSQEARAYTLFLLLSTLSLIYLWRAMSCNDRWQWVGFCCALTLALYTHYFALFVVAAEGLFGALVLGRAWLAEWRTGGGWPVPVRVRAFGLSLLALLLAYLPWLPVMRVNFFERQLRKENAVTGLQVTPMLVVDQLAGMGPGPGWATWLVLGLAVIGLAILIWQRRWRVLLIVGLVCVGPWAVLALATPRKMLPRYVIFMVPIYYGLVAAGAVALAKAVPRTWWRRRKWIDAASASLLVGLAFVMPSVPGLSAHYAERKMDLRGVAWFLERNVQPSQPIAAPGYDHFLVPYQPALEEHLVRTLSLEAAREVYHAHPRVWFVQGWAWRVNIDQDGSMTAWADQLSAVVVDFHDIRVLYLGEGVPPETLMAEGERFELPDGVTIVWRE